MLTLTIRNWAQVVCTTCTPCLFGNLSAQLALIHKSQYLGSAGRGLLRAVVADGEPVAGLFAALDALCLASVNLELGCGEVAGLCKSHERGGCLGDGHAESCRNIGRGCKQGCICGEDCENMSAEAVNLCAVRLGGGSVGAVRVLGVELGKRGLGVVGDCGVNAGEGEDCGVEIVCGLDSHGVLLSGSPKGEGALCAWGGGLSGCRSPSL